MIEPNKTAGPPPSPPPPRGLRRGLLYSSPSSRASSASSAATTATPPPPPSPPGAASPTATATGSPSASAGLRGYRGAGNSPLDLATHRLRSSWGKSPVSLPPNRVPELHGLIAGVSAVKQAASRAPASPTISAAGTAAVGKGGEDGDDDDGGGGAGLLAWQPVLDRIESTTQSGQPPEASMLDSRGRTALHAACARRPPPVVVSALLDSMSGTARRRAGEHSAVSARDNRGATPLLIAVENGASLGCVRALLRANPTAAGVADHVGRLPLHLACAGRTDEQGKVEQVELVRMVLGAHPEGVTKLNNKDRNPVHLAVEGGCRPEVVRTLVEANPEAVTMDECGSTPLALAIQHSSDVETVRTLVTANPSVVRKEDRSGPPLRKAVEYQASAAVIELLCDGPDMVESVDSIGRTPLHLALQWSAYNFGVVKALLLRAPHVSTARNRQGTSPLDMVYHHYARTVRDLTDDDLTNLTGRASQAWRAVLLMLRAARYGTVDDDDDSGGGSTSREWKVLHVALTTDVPVEVVRTAMAMRPREVMEVDEDGRTPLSLAIVGPAYSKSRIVDLLLDANPAAAAIPDVADGGGRYPLVQAAHYGWLKGEVVHKLIQCYPDALNTVDVATGLYPFQVAAVPKGRVGSAEEDEMRGRRASREMYVQWGWETDKDLLQTNAIFELLQAAPDLLMHGISPAT